MSTTNSFIDGFGSYWAPSSVLANPNLKWETTVTQNIGLDFGFFKNRLNVTFVAYKNRISGRRNRI